MIRYRWNDVPRNEVPKKCFFWLALSLLVLLSACAPKQAAQVPQITEEPSYVDALGHRYAQKESPRRIVSLSPAVTEILFAIGAGDHVVGVTQYCDYPPEAKTRTSIGGFSGATMSIEQIRVLEPDLVILSADMHARIVALLDELGIPSLAVEPKNFSQVYGVIALIGEICGCSSGADGVITEMKGKIAAVEERFRLNDSASTAHGSSPARPSVFWVLSEDPLMSAGPGTFVSEAISLAGGKNIFADVREQWPLVSPEQVLLRKPEWILLGSDMTGTGPGASGRPLLAASFWKTIPAVKEGRIALVNGDLLYRYGPRLADAVVSLAEILFPPL